MVQVDVFWSYGIGAGAAVGASRQLLERRARKRRARWDDNPYLLKTVLYLALLFAPSGMYLVWAFPTWETMQAGDRDLPAWLVTTFVITNVTQGVLGFWIAERLLIRGKGYAAFLQMPAAYFALYFILVHGWDGEGYRRFFSETPDALASWQWSDVGPWFGSDVAITLGVMGLVLLPVLFGITSRWMVEGHRAAQTPNPPTAWRLTGLLLLTIWGVSLPSAVGASLLVHALGWLFGALAFAVLAWLLIVRRGSVLWWMYRALGIDRLIADAPVGVGAETRASHPVAESA